MIAQCRALAGQLSHRPAAGEKNPCGGTGTLHVNDDDDNIGALSFLHALQE